MAPPAMFSTITDWLQVRASLSASRRAIASVVEPPAAGTTSRTTWDGKASSAWAVGACHAASASKPNTAARDSDRIVSSDFVRDSIAPAAALSRRVEAGATIRYFLLPTWRRTMAYDLEQFCAEARTT